MLVEQRTELPERFRTVHTMIFSRLDRLRFCVLQNRSDLAIIPLFLFCLREMQRGSFTVTVIV